MSERYESEETRKANERLRRKGMLMSPEKRAEIDKLFAKGSAIIVIPISGKSKRPPKAPAEGRS